MPHWLAALIAALLVGLSMLADFVWTVGKCFLVVVLTLLLLKWGGCLTIVQTP